MTFRIPIALVSLTLLVLTPAMRAATYAHLEWLTNELRSVLPVHVVRKERRGGC